MYVPPYVPRWHTVMVYKPTHLNKDAKEELRAELLDPLGHRFLVITVRCLFLDLCCRQAQVRSTFCMQKVHRDIEYEGRF